MPVGEVQKAGMPYEVLSLAELPCTKKKRDSTDKEENGG
jgi:hypothetical protein